MEHQPQQFWGNPAHITFTLNRYKKYCTVPEVYVDDKIYSIMVSPLTQSVNRTLAEIPNKFR